MPSSPSAPKPRSLARRPLPANECLPEATRDIYEAQNCDVVRGGGVLGFLKRLRYRMHNATGLYMLNKFERWVLCELPLVVCVCAKGCGEVAEPTPPPPTPPDSIFFAFFYSCFLIIKHWFYPSRPALTTGGIALESHGPTPTLLSGFGGVWLEEEHWKDLLKRLHGL